MLLQQQHFFSYLLLRYSSTSEHHTYRTATEIQRLRHTHNHPYFSVKNLSQLNQWPQKSVQIILAIIMAVYSKTRRRAFTTHLLCKANYL